MKKINRLLTFVVVMLFVLNSIVLFSIGYIRGESSSEKKYQGDITNLLNMAYSVREVADEETQDWIDRIIESLETPSEIVIIE